MDEELKAYLDAMMKTINERSEVILERMAALSRDFRNTKEFLIEDALVTGRRITSIENRLDDKQ